MIAPNRDRARREWHGPLEAREIAARCRFATLNQLYLFWNREKAGGRLPNARRPFFLSTAPAADVFSADELFSGRVPAGDPLLKRLRAAHGRDPRRLLDARAGAILAKSEHKSRIPTRGACAMRAQILDVLMMRAAPQPKSKLKKVNA